MRSSASAVGRLLVLWLVALVWWPARARADDDELRFAVVTHALPARLCAAEKLTVDVVLRNDGAAPAAATAADDDNAATADNDINID